MLCTILASCTLGLLLQDRAMGQLIPDGSLETERSRVQTIDMLNDRIEGGASRGTNLFHSFREFNVGEGRGVFFSNPIGINNILTRVTGNNPSNIFGRLGVAGSANLFLLNPHGIVFGPKASLDVQGSFLATTATSIALGDQGIFSAANPEDSQLLSIKPGALYFHEVTTQPGSITNQGNLAAGKDLTLSAGNLNLQGQLLAGGDLNLLATDKVTIRDTVANPFIAAAGNELLIQGNQLIDTFALNHSESGLFSRGDMLLRSDADVIGDIHFSTGGSFEIETLDGQLGNLFSAYDPIIRSEGDVSFFGYQGTSLHILAGGSVDINTVILTGPDTVGGSINPTSTPELANVNLSDGSSIVIRGNERPTLDIRAGINLDVINIPLGTSGADFPIDLFFNTSSIVPPPNNSPATTNADIKVENISSTSPNGFIFLTNQYKNNSNLSGKITVGTIDVSNDISGGSIIFDSRGKINIKRFINTSGGNLFSFNFQSNGGDISLIAKDDITLEPNASIFSAGLLGGSIKLVTDGDISASGGIIDSISFTNEPNTIGGNINVDAQSISFKDGAGIGVLTFGQANAGDLVVQAESLEFIGTSPNGMPSGLFNQVAPNATGNGGNLSINTKSLHVMDGGNVSTATFGFGSAGNLQITASEIEIIGQSEITLRPSGLFASSETNSSGKGGNLTISTNSLKVDGAIISASTAGPEDGGNIKINAKSVEVTGTSKNGFFPSAISVDAIPGSLGNGGNLTIESDLVIIKEGGQVSSSTFGLGNAGDIKINSKYIGIKGTGNIGLPSGLFSSVEPGANGQGGNLIVDTSQLYVEDGGLISVSTLGTGNAGNLLINADTIKIGGISKISQQPSAILSEVSPILASGTVLATGNGGNLNVNANILEIVDGARISANTNGIGNSGSISIAASKEINLLNNAQISTSVGQTALGNSQKLTLATPFLNLSENSQISAVSFGRGNAGEIQVLDADLIYLDNSTISTFISESASTQQQSNINLQALQILLQNNSEITASTAGQGAAGNILVRDTQKLSLDKSRISSAVLPTGLGIGGNIEIQSDLIQLVNSEITAATFGEGDAGQLSFFVADSINLDKSTISTEVNQGAIAQKPSNINFLTKNLTLRNNSEITANTAGQGPAGNILVRDAQKVLVDKSTISSAVLPTGLGIGGNIEIQSELIQLDDQSQISASTTSSPQAGEIIVKSNNLDINTGSQIITSTSNSGNAGNINIFVRDDIKIHGQNSGFFANTTPDSSGNAGNIFIDPILVELRDGAKIVVSSQGSGQGGNLQLFAGTLILDNQSEISASSIGVGNAGDIFLTIQGTLSSTDSDISTTASKSSGGSITISAKDIRLFGDSDIRTNVSAGANRGGDITLNADSIIAFGDSDILAFSQDGEGGNINLNTPIFLGENFVFRPNAVELNTLDGNNRVDLNASGAVSSGAVSLPDVSFIEESLNELPDNPIDTSKILANSCIVRNNAQQGNFIITGPGGLQERPGGQIGVPFPTGTVQSVSENEDSMDSKTQNGWKIGDPISEPDQIYQLSNGKLVMSRECS